MHISCVHYQLCNMQHQTAASQANSLQAAIGPWGIGLFLQTAGQCNDAQVVIHHLESMAEVHPRQTQDAVPVSAKIPF